MSHYYYQPNKYDHNEAKVKLEGLLEKGKGIAEIEYQLIPLFKNGERTGKFRNRYYLHIDEKNCVDAFEEPGWFCKKYIVFIDFTDGEMRYSTHTVGKNAKEIFAMLALRRFVRQGL